MDLFFSHGCCSCLRVYVVSSCHVVRSFSDVSSIHVLEFPTNRLCPPPKKLFLFLIRKSFIVAVENHGPRESHMWATFSEVSRDTAQGFETCV